MKFFNVEDIDKLFAVIDSCKGKVEMVTENGGSINLKSKLSQYVMLAKSFSGGEIHEIELKAEDPEDQAKLFRFMINGSGTKVDAHVA